MELGVLTNLYANRSLEDTLRYLQSLGVTMVEIGCGGYPGKAHADPQILLNDGEALRTFTQTIEKYGMKISALSTHGNPVHPDKAVAKQFHDDFCQTILLAEKLGIDTVVTFSGCPGDHEGAKYPNWVTCPWPEDYLKVLEYQWNDVLIPYWKETVKFANAHGVKKIAFEMHQGFCVYNPETLLKLRDAVGETIGANFDPSHLIWQGNDIVASIRELKGAIYHFHAKDTKIDAINTARKGVLDTVPYGEESSRSWIFRTVGYGNGQDFWKDVISELRMAGYDDIISIEHEDSLMSVEEGLKKAVAMIREVIISEKPADMWWA